MLYDLLLTVAVLVVVTVPFLPLTGGEAVTADRHALLRVAYQWILLAVIVFFFGWFWTHGGQTLGMVAWRLRLQRADGSAITWADVIKRMAAALIAWAPCGLGYFWIWIDRDKLAWPDRWTGTRVVVLPKKQR